MRKFIYSLLLPCALLLAGCNGQKGNSGKDSMLTVMDSTDAQGVQRMQKSVNEVSFKFKGKEYHSSVIRTPDESLPRVTNDMGDTYVDNKIVVHLTRDSETVLNKTFTKSDFASVVEPSFLSKSILEGIVYNQVTSQGIVYAASVCYPQTDLYVPLSITVTSNGKVSIRKVDLLEEGGEGEKE